jgi:cell division protein FtsI/penicillin-binding protein 2
MRAVVAEYPGTAHKPECGLFPTFDAAVKTGTAELDPRLGTNNAWIVGFAPYRAPRYAFVVCLEHVARGGHGGDAAGPVAAAALKHLDRANPGLGLRAAPTR